MSSSFFAFFCLILFFIWTKTEDFQSATFDFISIQLELLYLNTGQEFELCF